MLKLVTAKQFEKDFKRMMKRGKNIGKLLSVMQKLLKEETLSYIFRDHSLKGSLIGRRECHIETDWLLIYIKKPDKIIFERTGTHSDLFK